MPAVLMLTGCGNTTEKVELPEISTVEKTGTDGTTDTYTITYSDGSTKTFTMPAEVDPNKPNYDTTNATVTRDALKDIQGRIDLDGTLTIFAGDETAQGSDTTIDVTFTEDAYYYSSVDDLGQENTGNIFKVGGNAVIAGASFAPMMMGSDYLVQSSAFAAGRLAQNLINRKNIPQEIPLTDTELIELAGLIENLQDKIIDAYYNYKSSLTQLKETRAKLLLYNKNYSKALETNDLLEITISSSLYDNMALEEFYYMQNAKKYHLELQRMAGKKVVDKLNLYQYNFDSALVKGEEKE